MTDKDDLFLRKWAAEIGPTVDGARNLLEVMKPLPVCAACSAARWYKVENKNGKTELECFCTEYRGVMYNGLRSVTACDAREDVIERHKSQS
jgi:hypothetical protein